MVNAEAYFAQPQEQTGPTNATKGREALIRKVLAVMAVAAVAGVVGLLSLLPVAAQQGASATRFFDPASVTPGGRVVVTINLADYGPIGGVTETLPAGFGYVLNSSTLDAGQVQVTGQRVRFTLQGTASFTYTVDASSGVGSHTFSGYSEGCQQGRHSGRRRLQSNG